MVQNPILSINIPTYNRAVYLSDLLECIYQNIQNHPEIIKDIELNIFDNNSPDNTKEIVNKFKEEKLPFINYIKRTENIGADSNIYSAYKDNNGEYVWVIGDDELLDPEAIHLVLKNIKKYNPSILISLDVFEDKITIFDNYKDFAQKIYLKNIKYLLWHTLISANIIKKSIIDFNYYHGTIDELYGHMYGMFNNLNNSNYNYEKFIVLNSCVIVREERPPFDDLNLYKIITEKQEKYIEWLCGKLKLNKFIVKNIIFIPRKYKNKDILKKMMKNIFSVTNVSLNGKKTHKQLIIFGIKFKFKIKN